MQTAKQSAKQLIEQVSDQASWDDIILNPCSSPDNCI